MFGVSDSGACSIFVGASVSPSPLFLDCPSPGPPFSWSALSSDRSSTGPPFRFGATARGRRLRARQPCTRVRNRQVYQKHIEKCRYVEYPKSDLVGWSHNIESGKYFLYCRTASFWQTGVVFGRTRLWPIRRWSIRLWLSLFCLTFVNSTLAAILCFCCLFSFGQFDLGAGFRVCMCHGVCAGFNEWVGDFWTDLPWTDPALDRPFPEPPCPTAQNFSLLFFRFPPQISLSFLSLWSLLCGGVSRPWTTRNERLGTLGSSCETPAAQTGRQNSNNMTAEKPKRTIWVVHGLEPRPQFHEKTRREKKTSEIWNGRRKKKSEKCWAAHGPSRHPLGPPRSGPPHLGPHSPTLWAWPFRPRPPVSFFLW